MAEDKDEYYMNDTDIDNREELALQLEDDDDILKAIEEPKVPETQRSAAADDSVKIYLQQIGKI